MSSLFQAFKQRFRTDIAWTRSVVFIELSFLVVDDEERNATNVERLTQLVVLVYEQVALKPQRGDLLLPRFFLAVYRDGKKHHVAVAQILDRKAHV